MNVVFEKILRVISCPFFRALEVARSPPTIFSFFTTFLTALLNGARRLNDVIKTRGNVSGHKGHFCLNRLRWTICQDFGLIMIFVSHNILPIIQIHHYLLFLLASTFQDVFLLPLFPCIKQAASIPFVMLWYYLCDSLTRITHSVALMKNDYNIIWDNKMVILYGNKGSSEIANHTRGREFKFISSANYHTEDVYPANCWKDENKEWHI